MSALPPGNSAPSTLPPPDFNLADSQNEGLNESEMSHEEGDLVNDAPGDGKINVEEPNSNNDPGEGDQGAGGDPNASVGGNGDPGAGEGNGGGETSQKNAQVGMGGGSTVSAKGSSIGSGSTTAGSKGSKKGNTGASGGKETAGGSNSSSEGGGPGYGEFAQKVAKPVVEKDLKSIGKFSKSQQETQGSESFVNEARRATPTPDNEKQSQEGASRVNTAKNKNPKPGEEARTRTKFIQEMERNLPKKLKQVANFKKDGKAKKMLNKAKEQINVDAGEVNTSYKPLENLPPKTPGYPATPIPEVKAASVQHVEPLGQNMIAEVRPQDIEVQSYLDESDALIEKEGITQEHLDLVTDGDLYEAKLAREEMNGSVDTAGSEIEEVRKQEVTDLDKGLRKRAGMKSMMIKGARKRGLDQTKAKQEEAVKTLEERRKEVADEVMSRYQKVQSTVKTKLNTLNQVGLVEFNNGEKKASNEFSNAVDKRIKAFKKKRYKGIGGKIRWGWDLVVGINKLSEVKEIIESEKEVFVNKIDALIQTITKRNNEALDECRAMVETAREEIQTYIDGLAPELMSAANEAKEKIEYELEELEEEINRKEEELAAELQVKKDEAIAAIDEKIEELKKKMGGLVAKIGKFLLDAALKFIEWALKGVGIDPEPVLNVIRTVAGVIAAIVKNPIGFLKNLIKVVGGAFKEFFKNIKDNVLEAVMGWLTGQLAGTNIEIPTSFSLRSILKFVMQVLGISLEQLKDLLFGKIGAKAGGIIEGIVEVVSAFFTGGPEALWQALKQQFIEKGLPEVTDQVTEAVGAENMQTAEAIGNMASGAVDAAANGALPDHVVDTVKDKGWDWLRGKLVDRFGEEVVSTIEKVGKMVKDLVTEGPMALWEFIKESAGELKEMFFDAIKTWATSELVKKGIEKLLTFLIPGGGIIEAVIGIFKSIMFFIENSGLLGKIVGSVFGAVGDIASGDVGSAMGKIVNAIKLSLTALIKWFAKILNLDKIVDVITNVIEKIRGFIQPLIEKAMDFIVNGLKSLFQKIKDWFKSLFKKDDENEEGEGEEQTEEITLDPATGWPVYVGNPEKTEQVHTGIRALIDSTKPYLNEEDKLAIGDAQKVANDVKSQHSVFSSLQATPAQEVPGAVADRKDGEDKHYYLFTASPMQIVTAGFAGPDPNYDKYVGQTVDEEGQVGAYKGQLGAAKEPGVNVREIPNTDPGTTTVGQIPYQTGVYVKATDTTNKFYYVIGENGVRGWMLKQFVLRPKPEPGASVHFVQEPNLLTIMENHYVSTGKWDISTGNDYTTLAAAILAVNDGNGSISVDMDGVEAFISKHWIRNILDEQMTENKAIFANITVYADRNMWLPSVAYIKQLQKEGAIGSRSDSVNKLIEVGQGLSGFTIGVTEGLFKGLWDMLTGLWDLGEGIIDTIKGLLDGSLFASLKDIYENLKDLTWEKAEQMVAELITMGKSAWGDFKDHWNSADMYKRWHFRGSIVGQIALEVILAIFSGGASLGAKVLGKLGKYFPKLKTVMNKLLDAADELDFRPRKDRKDGDREDNGNGTKDDREWAQTRMMAALVTEGHDAKDTPVSELIPFLNATFAAKSKTVSHYEAKPKGDGSHEILQLSRRNDVDKHYTGKTQEEQALDKRVGKEIELPGRGIKVRGFNNAGEMFERLGNLKNRIRGVEVKGVKLDDAKVGIRGSAVTGVSSKGGEFRWTGKASDVDFFVYSPKLEALLDRKRIRFKDGVMSPDVAGDLDPKLTEVLEDFGAETYSQIGRKSSAYILRQSLVDSLGEADAVTY